MGLFDFFKKEDKPEYDVNNIRVTDLRTGWVFDYDLSTWEVLETYEYDWGDETFTLEYKVTDGKRTSFLSVEEDDELFITFMDKVKIRKIKEDLPEIIRNEDRPPAKIVYNGRIYLQDSETPGYFNDGKSDSKDNWEELMSWNYIDQEDEYALTIEQWDDNEFEAAQGKVLKAFEISNILPH